MPDQGPSLRDIHVPHVSPWWPLAPGWWALAALFAAVVIVAIVMWRRRAAWRRYVGHTLMDLRAATRQHAQDGDNARFAAIASQLLRRVARTRDPRAVTLHGTAWRDALASMAPGQDVSRLARLEDALYRPVATLDVPAVARDAEIWVRAALRRRKAHVAA